MARPCAAWSSHPVRDRGVTVAAERRYYACVRQFPGLRNPVLQVGEFRKFLKEVWTLMCSKEGDGS